MSALEEIPGPAAPEPPPDRPTPQFEILSVQPVERAASPTLRFRIGVSDLSGRPVYTIALTALITIEPSKRRYEEGERASLVGGVLSATDRDGEFVVTAVLPAGGPA